MSIARSLKVKADEAEEAKKELELSQTAFLGYKEARKKEDVQVKELVDEIKAKNAQDAEDVKRIQEENDRLRLENGKLKKELDSCPPEEEVLS